MRATALSSIRKPREGGAASSSVVVGQAARCGAPNDKEEHLQITETDRESIRSLCSVLLQVLCTNSPLTPQHSLDVRLSQPQ